MPAKTMKRRTNKQPRMKGEGLKEIAQKIYNAGKSVYDKIVTVNKNLKEKKYAKRLVDILPEVKNVPYVGNAVGYAAEHGYGMRKMKGRGNYPLASMNTPQGVKYFSNGSVY